MCIQDCLRDPGKGLSQDQSFILNWAPRSKSKCLVFPGPENTVHICVLFGILSVVQSCVFVQSQCPRCMRCQYILCQGWEWGGAPRGLWPSFWSLWGGTLVSSWSQTHGGSPEPKGIQFAAVLTSKDTDPQGFYNYWYLRTAESFFFQGITRKEFSTDFWFWKPNPQDNQSGHEDSFPVKISPHLFHHLTIPPHLTLHSGPSTFTALSSCPSKTSSRAFLLEKKSWFPFTVSSL